MKRLILVGLALAAFAGFAGTCSVINVRITSFANHKTLGGELQNNSGADLLQHNIRVTFFDSNSNIVDVYMRRLRKKLEADADRPQHIISVRGIGYKFIGK